MARTTRSAWFVPFRMPEAEQIEAWFEERAAEGWAPGELRATSAIRFALHRDESAARYRYVVDQRPFPDAEGDIAIEAAGWEEIGQLGGRDVWRRPYEGERPGSFSTESLVERRWHLSRAFAMASGLAFVVAIAVFAVGTTAAGEDQSVVVMTAAIAVLVGVVCAAVAAGITRRTARQVALDDSRPRPG
ncbi:uncharacterized protein DUF2812 [Mumia flava]|uniref:Uncharacterized protein DUF2812 n=2 Tax=Mumia flava TaxID=1348852 RepID=A0A0B2BNS5_9ACTN|nr:uncharacterized protein DUF2812 [Mumia flava]